MSPLIKSKSKKAFEKNISTEMHAGKPQDQALAIAYATKRRAPKKKMESGGMVKSDMAEHFGSEAYSPMEGLKRKKMMESGGMIDEDMDEHFGEEAYPPMEGYESGGMVEEDMKEHFGEEPYAPMEGYSEGGSVAEQIMRKRKMMADGGEVDLQSNSDEDLNLEDDLSFEAARKKTYFDDSQISKQPMGSNEHGHALSDEDAHDMVSKIRRKMAMKKLG